MTSWEGSEAKVLLLRAEAKVTCRFFISVNVHEKLDTTQMLMLLSSQM